MQKILLSKDEFSPENLYPFTLIRDYQDIRVGILTIKEKWELLLKNSSAKIISEDNEEENKIDCIKIPMNVIPSLELINQIEQATIADAELKKLDYPWHIFQNNDWAIRQDFDLITNGRASQKISSTNKIIGSEKIFLEEGASVEHSFLNASQGPIYIGKNAEVMEGCMIRGPFAMCEGSLLKMGTKVYAATTIGPYCIAAGEIKNSVMFGYSNKAHDGYLGDSVIGEWCNLGAGTSNSNIKNTAGEVMIWNEQQKKSISAGMKCGLLMGDYSRSAINTSFNTGTVVGVACNTFCKDFPPRYIQSFSWGDKNYELEKALQHINNWKKLKGKSLTTEEINLLSDIYHQKNKNA